jgi:hypothetical protein
VAAMGKKTVEKDGQCMVPGATTGGHNGCRSRRKANKIGVRRGTRFVCSMPAASLATLAGHSSFSSGGVQSA